MSMTLEAPFNAPVTILILPNPDLDNTESQDLEVNLKLAIDGTRSTYVKSSDQKTLNFTWNVLGRGKIVEVQEFFKLYVGQHIKLTDFRDNQWDSLFGQNPIDTPINSRSFNSGGARKESGSLDLEFLGTQI